MHFLWLCLSRSSPVMTSLGSSFIKSTDVGCWPSNGFSCEGRQCFQADTLHALCPVHFQLADMLSKFCKQQLWCLQSITHQHASQAFSYLKLLFFSKALLFRKSLVWITKAWGLCDWTLIRSRRSLSTALRGIQNAIESISLPPGRFIRNIFSTAHFKDDAMHDGNLTTSQGNLY